ncbi:S-adenosyl-L-methionine-dependent methyltransferase [Armillaria mellea]|nr:S-adenosyl-L-methionine-dependent methyltransferase [Armillaria mellea]
MPSQLSQLVSLIADATKFVEDTFAKTAEPNIPSLDDAAPHPLDDQVSSMEMKEAIQTIEGACAQLCALVARPSRTMVNRVYRVVVDFKIADHLLEKPQGAEPQKLGRIMRLLASKHCFREVDRDVFANNRLSMMLLSANALSSSTDFVTDEANKAASMLTETLKDPDWGHSYSPFHAPFNFWSKYPGSIFSWYEDAGSDIIAAKGARFGKAMKAWDDSTELWAVLLYVTVGGGTGVTSMQLANTYPNLRIVLQDLPAPIELAKNEIWPKSCPAAIEDGHVEFRSFDFLTESPVQGHNWPDKECKIILKGVGNVMSADSRLLICKPSFSRPRVLTVVAGDYIIQHPAPEPLLPNYGAGRMTQYNIDVEMMCVCNSQERSLGHFVELGKEAGLRFVRVWDAREASIFEFCLE